MKKITLIFLFLFVYYVLLLLPINSIELRAQTLPCNSSDLYYPPVILESVELPVRDADGIALGDLTGDGNIDILTSDGDYGTTMWFEQGKSWRDWTKHHIHTIDKQSTEIEGNAMGDFNADGRLEAISLDQPNGDIYLHKHSGNPRDLWQTAIIRSNRPLVQDAMIEDIDGDGRSDIVYTWQGRKEGEGGVHWLKLIGNDPLNANHWKDYVMITHESAWWLVPRRTDLSGNGEATDIIYTAKNSVNRNAASKPGLFWLEPFSDVTKLWQMHLIDDSIFRPAHVDKGDLSGEGHGNDLIVSGFDTDSIYWYEYSSNWKRHELKIPAINNLEPDYIWNVKTMRLGGHREGFITPVIKQGPDRGALLFYEFLDGQFEPQILRKLDYTHPMDDRILLYDITGDGQAEIFIPDSGSNVNKLHILRIGRACEQ